MHGHDAIPPRIGWVPTLAALLYCVAALPQPSEQNEPGALLGPDTNLGVAFEGAAYALGWTDHNRASSAVAGDDEKLLIFRLLVENRSNEEFRFDASALSVRAIDETGLVHEWPSTMHLRSAGPGALAIDAQRIFRTVLLPQRGLHVYSAIPVPARARIDRLLVAYSNSERTLEFEARGNVDPLPEPLAAGPYSVRRTIEAGRGDWLAGTSLDLRVEGSTVSSQPIGNRSLDEDHQWVLVTASVRNRSAEEQVLSPAGFRHTRLVIGSGAEIAAELSLYPERLAPWRPELAPGATSRFRLAFRVPTGSTAEALHVKVVGNEGEQSHLYRVMFGGSRRLMASTPYALGVFVPGAFVAEALYVPAVLIPGESPDGSGAAETADEPVAGAETGTAGNPSSTAADGSEETSGLMVRTGLGDTLYTGVDNPLEVVTPGTDAGTITLQYPNATFRSDGGHRYTMIVGWPGTANLNVYSDGQLIGSRELVTKRLPDPVARLGRVWDGRMSPSQFKAQGGVGAFLDDFPYNARCDIVGFQLSRLPSAGPRVRVDNAGARFVTAAKALRDSASSGDVYLFTNVRAKCPGDIASRSVNPMVFIID